MRGTIQVERDTDGIQIAVREMFEESFFDDAMRPLLAKIGDDDESRSRILGERPLRSLSPGYYDRCVYLMDLGAAMNAGAKYSADLLRREDVLGLQAIRQAKAEFERDHPSCPGCGARQDNQYMHRCRRCQMKLGSGEN